MTELASRTFTVADKRRFVVNYCEWLRHGTWLTAAQVTVDVADVTISGVQILEGHKVEFFVAGGSLNESFIVSVHITANTTETSTDTLKFLGVAP